MGKNFRFLYRTDKAFVLFRYARQVVDETMRCSVLAPFAARFSEYDMVVGGHVIPKQVKVFFNVCKKRWMHVPVIGFTEVL